MTERYQDIESALLLNAIPEIGPARYRALVDHFGSPAAALSAPVDELKKIDGMTKSAASNVSRQAVRRDWVKKEMELAKANRIEILCWEDPAYPDLLKTLSDPPPILYCKGDLNLLGSESIAMVGSRRSTHYGEKVSHLLSRGLAHLGITTASGLARGIDTHVHEATVEAGGKTIAILGSGLLCVYPGENKKLAEKIFKSGLMVSEFPLKAEPIPGNFPRRNRIVAGLSLGTVVIEAGEKSGALITARYAAEQGKEVFAVPGPITSGESRGPNRLIKEGAKPVTSVEDILEEIAIFKERFADMLIKEREFGKELDAGPLNEDEFAVLGALCDEPIHIDRLNQQFSFTPGVFSKVLLDLELKGKIKTLPGKMYVRI